MGTIKLLKFAYLKTGFIAGLFAAFFVTSVQAQDAIADRKAMMQAVGASMKASGAMAKGQKPFDAGTAELAMRAMNAVALGIDSKFPADSKTGGKTTSAPKIWEDMGGFKAALAKFAADTGAGIEAAKGGEANWKAAFGKVAQNCKSCHQSYRVKKN